MEISAIVIMIMLDIEKHHGNWNLCIGRYANQQLKTSSDS